MIPVVDDEGSPKCSFDARSDAMRGRFRRTTCKEDNVLQVTTYDDVLCSQESEYGPAIKELVRGECQPLKMKEERRRLQDDKTLWEKANDRMCGESNNSFTDMIQNLLCKEDNEGEDKENP